MPDVSSNQPADVRLWVSLDVHKLSIVAATLPATGGGKPEVARIETTEKAIRRFIDKLGGSDGLAVCYEAGPGGFELYRLLTRLGVRCDVVAPSLIPVRAGDRVKTDRRDAKKLVTLYRGGLLRFVQPPTPETEGLRDLLPCRDDLRGARTAARHRVSKQLLRHGRIYPLSAAEVILTCPPEIASMPIEQLLTSQRGWGQVRSRGLLCEGTNQSGRLSTANGALSASLLT